MKRMFMAFVLALCSLQLFGANQHPGGWRMPGELSEGSGTPPRAHPVVLRHDDPPYLSLKELEQPGLEDSEQPGLPKKLWRQGLQKEQRPGLPGRLVPSVFGEPLDLAVPQVRPSQPRIIYKEAQVQEGKRDDGRRRQQARRQGGLQVPRDFGLNLYPKPQSPEETNQASEQYFRAFIRQQSQQIRQEQEREQQQQQEQARIARLQEQQARRQRPPRRDLPLDSRLQYSEPRSEVGQQQQAQSRVSEQPVSAPRGFMFQQPNGQWRFQPTQGQPWSQPPMPAGQGNLRQPNAQQQPPVRLLPAGRGVGQPNSRQRGGLQQSQQPQPAAGRGARDVAEEILQLWQ